MDGEELIAAVVRNESESNPDAVPYTESVPFSSGDFLRAHLVREPLYAEDHELWETLLREENEVSLYFRQIGMELVLDRPEGFAFLRQIEPVSEEKVPRLVHRRKLTYDATLLLVCLRDELNRFDAHTADQDLLFRSRRELHDLVGGFLRESNNQMRDVKSVDAAVEQLRTLGFLRAAGSAQPDSFEVRRIVKARFGADELEAIKERLIRHVESGA